jgi:hypothetical protein
MNTALISTAEYLLHIKGRQDVSIRLKTYTAGKADDPLLNEDFYAHGLSPYGLVLVFADGSTAKNPDVNKLFQDKFDGKSGGRVAAELVSQVAIDTGLTGKELVNAATEAIVDLYRKHFPHLVDEKGEIDVKSRIATTFAAIRFNDDATVTCTQVGDTAIRATLKDGRLQSYREERKADIIDAGIRQKYILDALARAKSEGKELSAEEVSKVIADGREAIKDRLANQWMIWNNDAEVVEGYDTQLKNPGFGYLNGSHVPDKFIATFSFDTSELVELILVSDGYTIADETAWPQSGDIEDWEAHIATVHQDDPQKYLKYPATKPMDDRGIMVATIA